MRSFWLWLLISLCFVLGVSCASRSCHDDSNCNANECCIEYFPTLKYCKDKSDDEGDTCLGQFHCDCVNGLVCTPHPKSIYNPIRFGIGTCRRAG